MKLTIDLVFSLRKVMFTLVAIATAFLVLDTLVHSFSFLFAEDFIELVDITLEANLPTWFSSTQLLSVGLCAYFIGERHRIREKKDQTVAWFVIAGFFAYMGIDDAARLHERLATITADAFLDSSSQIFVVDAIKSFPSYYWLIIFLPIFGGLALFMLIFLSKEFEAGPAMRLFLLGIGLYVMAVGLDYFDGIESNYDAIAEHTPLARGDARHIFRAVEEFIEMIGTTFILVAFLQHWRHNQLVAPLQPPR